MNTNTTEFTEDTPNGSGEITIRASVLESPFLNSELSTLNAPPPADTISTSMPWCDADYQHFVNQYNAGAYPELHGDPTAWDHHFVLTNDPDAPFRPTLISPDDFHAHLPACHRGSYGLLVLKLWEIARAKGFTADFEEQQLRARREQQQREEELRKQQLRGEIDALKHNLPTPEPAAPSDPRQQWYAVIMAAALPDATLVEKVKHVQKTVIDGQPFRNALLQDSAADVLNNTFGPVHFPGSDDIMTKPLEAEIAESEPVITKWNPYATSRQIVHGAARDLADLVSLLIARQKVAVGFAADHKTISEVRQLTRSLRELNDIVKETQRQKPGPKPKTAQNDQ